MALDCPVHFPPLGSPQGCFHFRYSLVSCSEVLCSSHWQIGLAADAAVSKHKTAISSESIYFVKSQFCPLSSPSHISHEVSPQSFPFSQQQTCQCSTCLHQASGFTRLTIHLKITGRSLSNHDGECCSICCSTPCFNQCGYSKELLTQQFPLKPAIAP